MKSLYGYLLLTILMSFSAINAQDVEAIPFIYYYSHQEKAFLIERADGSEQSILARFEIGENASIGGAGWSLSGKWFSWNISGSPVVSDVYVVNRNESSSRSLFNSKVQLRKVEWSPIEDMLLIHFSNVSGSVDSMMVYDPNTDQIVFQMLGEELHPVTLETQLAVKWSPDGSKLAILDHLSKELYVVNRETWEITQTISATGTGYSSQLQSNILPQWLGDNHLIYVSPKEDQFIIMDVLTNEITQTALPTGERVEQLIKSPDSLYALIYTRTTDNDFNLWLLSTKNAQLFAVEDEVLYLPLTDAECSSHHSFWNENNAAFFFSDNNELYIIDAVNQATQKISSGRFPCHRALWSPQNTLMFTKYESPPSLYQTYEYVPESDQLSFIYPESEPTSDEVFLLALSSLGYRAYNQFIDDPTTLKRFPIEMLSSDPKRGTVIVSDARWHPSKPWLFLISWIINDLRLINVANFDSSIQRELGLCPVDSVTCFGWLPDSSS